MQGRHGRGVPGRGHDPQAAGCAEGSSQLILPASQERLERFQREAETLAALDHPNIVTVFTVERDEDCFPSAEVGRFGCLS